VHEAFQALRLELELVLLFGALCGVLRRVCLEFALRYDHGVFLGEQLAPPQMSRFYLSIKEHCERQRCHHGGKLGIDLTVENIAPFIVSLKAYNETFVPHLFESSHLVSATSKRSSHR
jgi:hypothetical protein